MSLHKSDDKLFELITAFVDGEASPDEIITLEKLRRSDLSIEKAIDAEIQIRQVVRQKCQKIHAPRHLKTKCLELLRSENAIANSTPGNSTSESDSDTVKIHQLNAGQNSINKKSVLTNRTLRWLVAASILFSIGFLSGQYSFPKQPELFTQSTYTYAVEDLVKRHFTLASDIQLNEINTLGTPSEAERYLNARMGFELTVPELDNATFIGIEMSEFVPGYSTPLLKYSVAGQNDQIHIFAFPIDKMDGDVRLIRDIEAIKKCKSASDTYIKDIDGKHIVSWKWGDVWYVGVSNHHGEVLASMLPTSK